MPRHSHPGALLLPRLLLIQEPITRAHPPAHKTKHGLVTYSVYRDRVAWRRGRVRGHRFWAGGFGGCYRLDSVSFGKEALLTVPSTRLFWGSFWAKVLAM